MNPKVTRLISEQYVQAHVHDLIYPYSNQSLLHQMTYFDVCSWLPDNTLAKSDKVSMSHSIELRVPFLNHELVEFAMKLDDKQKIRGNVGKWLVRQCAMDLIPDHIIRRPKAGFPVPIPAWIHCEWKEYVLSTLLAGRSITRELYNPKKIEGLYFRNDSRRTGRMLWALLTFELWYQHVFQ